MRTRILIPFIGLLASCSEQEAPKHICMMHDVTDSHKAILDSAWISETVLENEKTPWGEIHFEYRQISDVDQSKTETYYLESANAMLSNQFEREAAVDAFVSSITLIDTTAEMSYSNSAIWIPICKTVERYAEREGEVRIYIFSDLVENDFVDLYNKQTIKELLLDPSPIEKQYRAFLPKIQVENITVYLCYTPIDSEDNQRYRQILNIYETLLKEIGVTIKTASYP